MKLMPCHRRNQIVPATPRPAVGNQEEAWTLKSNVWRRQEIFRFNSYGDRATFHLRVRVEGVHPVIDRRGKSPAWNCFPETLLLLLPYSRCIANITAASPKRPGVHMDRSPKHVRWWHRHYSPHTTFLTKRDAGRLMSPVPSLPRWIKRSHIFLLLTLFLLEKEVKPIYSLHINLTGLPHGSLYTCIRHRSPLPNYFGLALSTTVITVFLRLRKGCCRLWQLINLTAPFVAAEHQRTESKSI